MFLKKVDLQGFKSFANKTTVDFGASVQHKSGGYQYGITAIVGPNGSGKSNIADALRWVMGEQSMKSLRSKKSDDVIFAGSAKQRKMNTASVTLHFDNADGSMPVEFSDVTISRTVYRDGAAEYRINDSKARLLDVVDVLAHAGLGKGSYSIITQGMTDALLSATPIERRGIIEDAAGVKPFQIKKHRALTKLDTTRANLERVAGLVQEIEPHLKMLKRQADRAAKAEDVADELRRKQQQLYQWRWNGFKKEQSSALKELAQHEVAMKKAQNEVDAISKELRAQAQEMESKASDGDADLLKRKRALGERLAQARKKLAIIDGRIALERERVAREIAGLKSRVPVDSQYVRTHLDNIVGDVDVALEHNDVEALKLALKSLRDAVTALNHDVERGSVDVDISAQKKQLQEGSDIKVSKMVQERSAYRDEIVQHEAHLSEIDKSLADSAAAERVARTAFFEQERELRDRERILNRLRDEYNDAKIRLARVEVREEDLSRLIVTELRMTVQELEECECDAVEDEARLEQRVARLKVQHESIGAIDPLVIEEYKETQERYDFLSQEYADLQKAIVDLIAVIKEMDHEIEKAFKKAFSFINNEFQSYFRMMFGGGKASLKKVHIAHRNAKDTEATEDEEGVDNPNEPDESQVGIIIAATPPGKHINNLAQLSGGERSLVSLALLFAVIAFNPPPFVVLDEVEAALDESNARRFGNILEALSQKTQFVVITHNRETMRHASVLYGVTMNQDGISRLLSVKIDNVGTDGALGT